MLEGTNPPGKKGESAVDIEKASDVSKKGGKKKRGNWGWIARWKRNLFLQRLEGMLGIKVFGIGTKERGGKGNDRKYLPPLQEKGEGGEELSRTIRRKVKTFEQKKSL